MKKILPITCIWLAATVAFILFCCIGCSHSKDVFKTETSTKSETRTEDSLKIVTLQRDTTEYLKRIREMEYLGVSFQECPELDTAAIKEGFAGYVPFSVVDSILKANTTAIRTTTVKKGADGSLEITGPIKSLTWAKDKLEQEAKIQRSTIQTLLEQQIKTAASVFTKTEQKEKHSKGGFLNFPWFWLLLAFLGGGYVGWRLRGGIKMIDKI